MRRWGQTVDPDVLHIIHKNGRCRTSGRRPFINPSSDSVASS